MTFWSERVKQNGGFAKQPRPARSVVTQSSFAGSTGKDGETKVIAGSKKRPGKLKWVPRGMSQPVPDIGQQSLGQARSLGQRSIHSNLSPLERAVKEKFGGYGQSFQ